MKCLICDKELTAETCHTIILTEEERRITTDPLDAYTYCKPCWKVISDPIRGPILMKGLVQQRMRLLGVSVEAAEALSTEYHRALVERITK